MGESGRKAQLRDEKSPGMHMYRTKCICTSAPGFFLHLSLRHKKSIFTAHGPRALGACGAGGPLQRTSSFFCIYLVERPAEVADSPPFLTQYDSGVGNHA